MIRKAIEYLESLGCANIRFSRKMRVLSWFEDGKMYHFKASYKNGEPAWDRVLITSTGPAPYPLLDQAC